MAKSILYTILLFLFASCEVALEAPTEEIAPQPLGGTEEVGDQDSFSVPSNLKITSSLPTGMQPSISKFVLLQVKTDNVSLCKFDTSNRNFGQLSRTLRSSDSGLSHFESFPVSAGQVYEVYVKCILTNNPQIVASSTIIFNVEQLGVPDTTPPVLINVQPQNAVYPYPQNSATLSLSTSELAQCRFGQSNDFGQMQPFGTSGGSAHSHKLQGLMPNSYSFFIRCSDGSGNVSQGASVSFKIEDLIVTKDMLRAKVKDIFNNRCSSCHGTNGQFKSIVDLSVDILELEKNGKYIKIMDPENSLLYQKISTGTMAGYIPLAEEKNAIYDWIKSVDSPADMAGPVITAIQPMNVVYPYTQTKVMLSVTTSENAVCKYSAQQGVAFDQMLGFLNTGMIKHTQEVLGISSGSYVYVVQCSDNAGNLSNPSFASFTIEAAAPSKDILRQNARAIFNNRCIACHGSGAQYQAVIDLSVDLKVLEKNTKYVKVMDPDNSYLYQKVTMGSMANYMPDPKERQAIYDWIKSVDGTDEIVVNCAADEAVLDNVCVKVGKVLRSHGYRMVTPEEMFKDINEVFYVNLENKDPVSGQPIVPEPKTNHGFDNQFGLVSANSVYVTAIEQVAELLGSALLAKSDFDPKNVSCMSDTVVNCGMTIAKNVYIPKLFRRDLTDGELTAYRSYFESATGDKKEIYINFFKALIQSPSFIFREEHGANPNPLHSLDAYEVASRLAYFVSGKGPDATLRAKAKDGSILNKAVRQGEAERLMAMSSTQQHLAETFMNSIGIKKLVHEESLTNDMIRETRTLVRQVFFSSQKWTNIFTANYTYLNKRLADLYKYNVQTDNSNWVKVNYPDANRSGILSHASYLSAFFDGKNPYKTKDIRRGINFYEKILCRNMPLPPADVDIDLDPANNLQGCRIDNRKNSTLSPQGTCIQCHQHFDRIGMGFERFNNIGEYRTVQEDDTSCSTIEPFYLDGNTKFNTMPEFTKAVSENNNVGRCLAVKMKSYAYGSEGSTSDLKSIFLEMENFQKSFNFQDLIKDIVGSDQFIKRESRDEK